MFHSRIAALAAVVSAATAAYADQVILTNGDIITGGIIKKDGGKLTIKSEFLGEVTMPWSAVKSIRSDGPLTVVLPGGVTVAGNVATTGDTLQVAAPSGTRTAPLADVSTVRDPAEQHAWERLQHPGMLELWAGSFDIGLTLARGNARTDTLASAFNAARVTTNDKLTLNFTQIHATARVTTVNGPSEVSTIASAIRGGWTYDHNLTPRVFLGVFNQYEHDSFQDLDLRFVAGGNVGINAYKNERTSLSLMAGVDYQRENFSSGLSRNSAELNFGNDLTYKMGATSFTEAFRVFTNMSDLGQYRLNFDAGAVTALKKWLGWHVTLSDRFLSNPVFGRQRNDVLLSTGLRVSFAR